MMSKRILARLRAEEQANPVGRTRNMARDAANEIDRLRAENEALRARVAELGAKNLRLRRRLVDCYIWMAPREGIAPGMVRICDKAREELREEGGEFYGVALGEDET